jgi:hypothetical protein
MFENSQIVALATATACVTVALYRGARQLAWSTGAEVKAGSISGD